MTLVDRAINLPIPESPKARMGSESASGFLAKVHDREAVCQASRVCPPQISNTSTFASLRPEPHVSASCLQAVPVWFRRLPWDFASHPVASKHRMTCSSSLRNLIYDIVTHIQSLKFWCDSKRDDTEASHVQPMLDETTASLKSMMWTTETANPHFT